jgi:two-component system nitrate/nitrite response regulator NarL
MSYANASTSAHAALVKPIRVFLTDDHQITLWGLGRLIDASNPLMEVIGTASSLTELLNDETVASADVILLDLDLDGEDALGSLASLRERCPGQVLILTASDDLDQHRRAMVTGARGVLHKSEAAETILRAIEKVHSGEIWLGRALLGEVMGMLSGGKAAAAPATADPNAQRIASLTPRELEIVITMARSAGSKQMAVAEDLGMSEHTLRNHLTTIYNKLGVRGRLELHVFSTAHGLGSSAHSASTK